MRNHISAATAAKLLLASLSLAVLTACNSDDGDDGQVVSAMPGDVTQFVPVAVTSDATVATSYTAALASTDSATTDTIEPVDVPETLAQDDTAEPV